MTIAVNDPHMRLPSGMTLAEAARRARAWWDATGRHVVRNRDFRDPDVGLCSGITRGLAFDELGREEAAAVIEAWHRDKVMALIPERPGSSNREFAAMKARKRVPKAVRLMWIKRRAKPRPQRKLDTLHVYCPGKLRYRVVAAASANGRSLSQEVQARLERSFVAPRVEDHYEWLAKQIEVQRAEIERLSVSLAAANRGSKRIEAAAAMLGRDAA